MVSVTAEQVRKRLGLTSADINDEDVLAFVAEATAFLSEEIGRTLDPQNCTEGDANVIHNLAAIYSFCHVSSGVAVGLNFSIGDLTVSESPAKQIAFLKEQVECFIKREGTFAPVLGEYEGS